MCGLESMNILEQWLADNNKGKVISKAPLGGGCINQTSQLRTDKGFEYCLKENPDAPGDFFVREAENLQALSESNSLRVPKVVHVDEQFLLLEFINAGTKNKNYWPTLARQLADCHAKPQKHFGFQHNNYCGLSSQINRTNKNGYDFFAECRLLVQCQWAREKNLLSSSLHQRIERLAQRLREYIPEQQPALTHGDLWGGNLHTNQHGEPVLLDPACYWGWPEADLAMTTLFGGFTAGFYQCYTEYRPLEPGWRERFPLYNLYHLLNHLNLFGRSYLSEVENVVNRFA